MSSYLHYHNQILDIALPIEPKAKSATYGTSRSAKTVSISKGKYQDGFVYATVSMKNQDIDFYDATQIAGFFLSLAQRLLDLSDDKTNKTVEELMQDSRKDYK
jgi:hypothetical protein